MCPRTGCESRPLCYVCIITARHSHAHIYMSSGNNQPWQDWTVSGAQGQNLLLGSYRTPHFLPLWVVYVQYIAVPMHTAHSPNPNPLKCGRTWTLSHCSEDKASALLVGHHALPSELMGPLQCFTEMGLNQKQWKPLKSHRRSIFLGEALKPKTSLRI